MVNNNRGVKANKIFIKIRTISTRKKRSWISDHSTQ
jgi:hypothetical protein